MQSVPIPWSATSHDVSAELSLAKSVSKLLIDRLIFIQIWETKPSFNTLVYDWHTVLYSFESLKNRSQSHMCSVGVGSALHSRSHTFWSAHWCKCLISTRCTRVIVCGMFRTPRLIHFWSCYLRGKWIAQLGILSHLTVIRLIWLVWWAIVSERVHLIVLTLVLLLWVENRCWSLSLHIGCSSRLECLNRRDFLSLEWVTTALLICVLLAFIVILFLIVSGHKCRSCLRVAEVRLAWVAIKSAIRLRIPVVLLLWVLISLIVLVVVAIVVVLTILSVVLVEVLPFVHLVSLLIVVVVLLGAHFSAPIITIIRVKTVRILLVRLHVLINVLISLAR